MGEETLFLLAYKFRIFNAYDEMHFCDFRWISVISDGFHTTFVAVSYGRGFTYVLVTTKVSTLF